jgi:hypothetical protein
MFATIGEPLLLGGKGVGGRWYVGKNEPYPPNFGPATDCALLNISRTYVERKRNLHQLPSFYLVSLQKLLPQSLSENVLELVEAFHPETGKEQLKKGINISKAKKKTCARVIDM